MSQCKRGVGRSAGVGGYPLVQGERRSAGVGGYAVVQEGVNRIAVQEGGRPQYRVYAAL